MKKRYIIIPVLAVILFLGYWLTHDYSFVLSANWGISIPFSAFYRQTYEADSGPSFHGDGTRYHVFTYSNEDAISKMADWDDEQGQSIYYGTYELTAERWLNEIDVDEDERPDYEHCLFFYDNKNDNSEIIMMLDKTSSKLYILERFL